MATKPRYLQPQTSTTTGIKNTHSILHNSHTLYKHNESDTEELIFYHNGGFLWVQKCWHKQLPQSWLAVHDTVKRCMCVASEKTRHPAVTLPHRIWFTWQRRLMCWCGTVSICMMQTPFCIAVTWISFYTATTRNYAGNTQSPLCGFNMITMFKFGMLVQKC